MTDLQEHPEQPHPEEIPLGGPRTWVELDDPVEPAQRVRADLTWLTSRWTCIFGRGCPGIDPEQPDAGCCTLGAHLTDEDDRARVAEAVGRLDATTWQRHGTHAGAWLVEEEDEVRTEVVGGGCVMLNREGFPGGAGCALHRLALEEGVPPHTLKPDVCWQVPVRRSYREVESLDETTYLEISLAEYDRRAWGPGGHDLHWWCTGSPVAHVGAEPVFVSMRPELEELIGPEAYAVLAQACEDHLALVRAAGAALRPVAPGAPLPPGGHASSGGHASPDGRPLLPFHVHPATAAAEQG